MSQYQKTLLTVNSLILRHAIFITFRTHRHPYQNNLDGVHIKCCGLHRYDIHLHLGKNRSFLYAQITSVRGRDRKKAKFKLF